MQHRLKTSDPISIHEINNLEGKSFVIEGALYNDVTIYFVNEQNKQTYKDIPVEGPVKDFSQDVGNSVDEGMVQG